MKLNATKNNEKRRPLTHVNKAQMNDEERQETRKKLFKQGSGRTKANPAPSIKGVRMNRRFELMMEHRNKN